MGWSRSDARARRPWIAGVSAVVVLVLLAPTTAWVGCADGTVVSACVERVGTVVGVVVPTTLHPVVWLLGGLVSGAIAWLAVSAVARRAARLEREDDLVV